MSLSSLAPSQDGFNSTGVTDNVGNTTLLPTTTNLPDHHENVDAKNHSVVFILVPLFTIGIIAVLTAMVLLFLRKKRLDRLRHRLMPFYNFEPGEEEDWETELLDEDSDTNNRKGRVWDNPKVSEENIECIWEF
ncbi:uncharacterized protein C3orf18 homolog isoform X2 [Lycorma delicatula]|uniref:uncharacterized protein C3orf18 homolog isoform X2 n=1 Tax=Lycorma delicatula TaxID=130591 RepID=UPI003F51A34E